MSAAPRRLGPLASALAWICQLIVALILGQTLFFKFTGAPESRYIFERLGAEPWGRLGSGAFEALAVLLILFPRTAFWGALLAAGTMVGAIGAHLAKLGIAIELDGRSDNGLLFGLACTALVASLIVIKLRR